MKQLSKRQEEIADAALGIIAQKGIQRLTTKNLSRAVGVTEPALYRHFKSKQELLSAIIRRYGRIITELFDEGGRGDGAALDGIAAIYEALLTVFTERPELSMIVFSDELFRHDPGLSKETLSIVNRMQDRIRRIIRAGIREGGIRSDIPATHLAWMIMGTMRMLISRWRMSGYSFNVAREGAIALASVRKVLSP